MLPALRAGGPSWRGSMKPGNARPDDPPGPRAARSRAALALPAPRDRARVEGAAAPVGPLAPPDVLVSRELSGGPRPRVHRPLQRPGRRRPRSVLRSRHRAAPGVRRGPDRRRQRPQPVRPPADRGQGRAGDPAPRREPGSPRSGSLGRARPADWRQLANGSWPARRIRGPCRGRLGQRTDGPARARPRRGRPRVPSADARAAAVRPDALRLDDRADRFLAAAITGILHGKSASYLSELMPNTFSMAPRYVRDFAARTASSRPSATCSTASERKLDRLYRQPLPPTPGVALLGDARDAPRAPRGAPRARAPGSGPAGRDLAALSAGRQVRLLQLAADLVPRLRRAGDRRGPRRRPPARAVPRVPARRPRRPPAGAHGRRGRRARDRRRRDRPRPADRRRGRPGRARLGGGGQTRRATGWRAWSGTRSPPTAR